jgi:hypothetical protein
MLTMHDQRRGSTRCPHETLISLSVSSLPEAEVHHDIATLGNQMQQSALERLLSSMDSLTAISSAAHSGLYGSPCRRG